MSGDNATDEVHEQLESMSQRLEIDVAKAVRDVFEKSGYFLPEYLDKLVYPVAGWACNLPYEAYEKRCVIIKD